MRIRNSAIAVIVVLDSRYHSRETLVKWLGHRYATSRETETSIPTTQERYERTEKRLRYLDTGRINYWL